MTRVTNSATTIEEGIATMIDAMKADYTAWCLPSASLPVWTVKYGRKYAKVVSGGQGTPCVTAFVVTASDDKKFRLGDLLKPSGWATPARNSARGNVLDGGYSIKWTGPLYLN
jgi:hypothetical protein|tara:strand:+ start:258 stop:596 length:339 start_codon:yes stop_codon:yes gene_type:complete